MEHLEIDPDGFAVKMSFPIADLLDSLSEQSKIALVSALAVDSDVIGYVVDQLLRGEFAPFEDDPDATYSASECVLRYAREKLLDGAAKLRDTRHEDIETIHKHWRKEGAVKALWMFTGHEPYKYPTTAAVLDEFDK
jgi:hypothetical protein